MLKPSLADRTSMRAKATPVHALLLKVPLLTHRQQTVAKPLTTHPLTVNSGSEVNFVKRIGVTENYCFASKTWTVTAMR